MQISKIIVITKKSYKIILDEEGNAVRGNPSFIKKEGISRVVIRGTKGEYKAGKEAEEMFKKHFSRLQNEKDTAAVKPSSEEDTAPAKKSAKRKRG